MTTIDLRQTCIVPHKFLFIKNEFFMTKIFLHLVDDVLAGPPQHHRHRAATLRGHPTEVLVAHLGDLEQVRLGTNIRVAQVNRVVDNACASNSVCVCEKSKKN